MKNAIVHDLDNATKREFKYLYDALAYVSWNKTTGYIVTPTRDIIEIHEGKRMDVTGKWIPAHNNYKERYHDTATN